MTALTQRDAGGTLRTIKRLTQRDASGTLRTLNTLWMRDAGNVLRCIYRAQAITISPSPLYGYVSSNTPRRVITDSVTATVDGGSGPFTYAWTLADTGWSALQASSATTAFQSPGIPPGDSLDTTATVIVTDSHGTVVGAASVEITASNISSGGGAV